MSFPRRRESSNTAGYNSPLGLLDCPVKPINDSDNGRRYVTDMQERPKSDNLIEGATGEWEVVIGMEVHAQVTSNAKLFSGASTEFGGEPNSHVSLVDAAVPGMLPVINEGCLAQAIPKPPLQPDKRNPYETKTNRNHNQRVLSSESRFPIVTRA